MSLTKILTFVLFAVSIYLAYFLWNSVHQTIEDRKVIATKEEAVIERLMLIREAELVFREAYGHYTSDWDSLINFVKNGQVAIIERREEIIPKPYGGEEVIVHIDTLGFIPARERIFKETYNVSAADNGIFMGFNVSEGDDVLRNQKAYSLKVDGKITEPPLAEEGTIDSLSTLAPGTPVTKGTILIVMWDYKFDPAVNIDRLPFKPGAETKFDIFVGKVDKAGVMVDVIEVKDPNPDNPMRRESNEAKNRQPLRFGSRTDVTTSGNWE